MKHLDDLAAQALLGTSRRVLTLPSVPESWAGLSELAAWPESTPEDRLLIAAGVLSIGAECGFVPAAGGPPPPPCSPCSLQTGGDPPAITLLQRILANGPDQLRCEAWQTLSGAGLSLPPLLLPDALALARKNAALRPALLPALGERGRWLARLNPEWAFAGEAGETRELAPNFALWEHGRQEQRRDFFAALRRRAPQEARALLEKDFAALDARERAGFLEAMTAGLSLADEVFLETALADRSKEVRQNAASLLARLPGSRYVARQGERLAACLSRGRKLFRQVLSITPPAAFAPQWKADALEESRLKNETLGERAWWLYQLARAMPLAWWTEQAGLAAADLIAWAEGGDWGDALARAWGEALARQPDATWAAAFLHHPLKGFPLDAFALIDCLPLPEREAHWLFLLDARAKRTPLGPLIERIVESAAGSFVSTAFAHQVLTETRRILPTEAGQWDYVLRRALPDFLCLLPPAALAEAAQGWPAGRPETEYFSETLATLLVVIENRQTLHHSFPGKTSP